MSNGLFLGISNNGPLMPAYQITSPKHSYKYVTVFTNRSTKLDGDGKAIGAGMQFAACAAP